MGIDLEAFALGHVGLPEPQSEFVEAVNVDASLRDLDGLFEVDHIGQAEEIFASDLAIEQELLREVEPFAVQRSPSVTLPFVNVSSVDLTPNASIVVEPVLLSVSQLGSRLSDIVNVRPSQSVETTGVGANANVVGLLQSVPAVQALGTESIVQGMRSRLG